MPDETFRILEPVEVGSLEDVKEQKPLIPPTKGVKVKVSRVRTYSSKDGGYRAFELGLQLVDGIDGKWKNSWVNSDGICYYADTNTYTKDFFKEKRHLINLKLLNKALGIKTTKVDDDYISSLDNKELIVDIQQTPNNYTTKEGVEVNETVNIARNFRAVPVDQQV